MQQEFSDKMHKHHYQNDEAERISQLIMTVAQRHYKLVSIVSAWNVILLVESISVTVFGIAK